MSIHYEKCDGLAYIKLNRPEVHNAFDAETLVGLAEAWDTYRDDSKLRCAILTAAGEKSFCSGADPAKITTRQDRWLGCRRNRHVPDGQLRNFTDG